MFSRLLIIIAILCVAAWLVQILLVHVRGNPSRAPRRYVMYDLAPLLAFFGAILLALSFVESVRREVLEAWRWGMALGVAASAGVWMMFVYRWSQPAGAGASAWRTAWRVARTYGALVLIVAFTIYLAVRVFGVRLEVFLAGAGGVTLIALAAAVFAREWRKANS